MYPILYRRKTRTCFLACLLLFALLLRVLCEPALREAAWEKTRAVLDSETLLRAVIFLETGVLPEKTPAAASSSSPGEDTAPRSEDEAAASRSEAPEALATQAPTAEAPTTAAPETAPAALPDPGPAPFRPEEAEAIGLRGSCSYAVDKAALLLRPLDWPDEPGPKILIIHSHSCESYTQSEGHSYIPDANFRTLDLSCNMIAVGDALAEELGALGIETVHDRTLNDYPSYNRSYAFPY